MPELPEVETIRRTLLAHIQGLEIKEVLIRWPGAVCDWRGHSFAQTLSGRRIESIERRGKYLLINMDEGWSVIAHMRMTGRLNYFTAATEPEKHTHVVFRLSRGELHFTDTRKFGRLQLVRTENCFEHPSLVILGPEPLAVEFSAGILAERLKGKKVNLKSALLNQTVLAGLGNIYVDEALFRAKLSPERCAGTLAENEVLKLYQSIVEVLQAGIAAQGTSFRDYRDANGEKGSFQKSLNVYGRAGQNCFVCGALLSKKQLGGRTTVFCPHCQV